VPLPPPVLLLPGVGHKLDLKGKLRQPRALSDTGGTQRTGADKRSQGAHRRTHSKGTGRGCTRRVAKPGILLAVGRLGAAAVPRSHCQRQCQRRARHGITLNVTRSSQGPVCHSQTQCPCAPSSLMRCGGCECCGAQSACPPSPRLSVPPCLRVSACASGTARDPSRRALRPLQQHPLARKDGSNASIASSSFTSCVCPPSAIRDCICRQRRCRRIALA
jgi:hypothetical protein